LYGKISNIKVYLSCSLKRRDSEIAEIEVKIEKMGKKKWLLGCKKIFFLGILIKDGILNFIISREIWL
jgi:hypothetical protein